MKVSIITPVYNGSRTIRQTIDSVLAQTEPDWEQIIIDDGSTDSTSSIVQSYADDRIRYYFQSNTGRSEARNRAMDLARGQYLLFLDADDWLLPNALKVHLAFLSDHPEFGVSVSDGYFCTDEGKELVSLSERRGAVSSGDVLSRIVVEANLIGAPLCVMMRRKLVQAHHLRFDPELEIGEDWLFLIEVAYRTHFGFIDDVTCMYRWHERSTTRSTLEAIYKDQLWRGREKVMRAPYFDGLPVATRRYFFYQLLVDLLAGEPAKQHIVLASEQFRALPRSIRGQLLRYTALQYLSSEGNLPNAKRWSLAALREAPWDIRSLVIAVLLFTNLQIAASILDRYRSGSNKRRFGDTLNLLTH
ncbi:MAG: glycosyltransferase family 2 protein [Chloroflexota bacterium]|jgi:glycosyltransferase involved in cell wall biosynthesis